MAYTRVMTKIKVAQNDPLGSLEPPETPSGCSCPPQLQLESRRIGGVLMGFLGVLAGVTKIKVAPNDPLRSREPSETPSGHSCPPQLQLGSRRTGGVLMGFLEVLAGVTKIKVVQFWRFWDPDEFI